MAAPVDDSYSVTSGGTMLGGVPPAVSPLRTGGTVIKLASTWTDSGFQDLTTAPTDSTIFRSAAHGGSCWDGARQVMWLFGANTHAIAVDMDNSVYGWRASDGKFIKHYDADGIDGYRMDANGILWSTASKNRPWGMHTFRRLRWLPESAEIEVMEDSYKHSGLAPIFENPAMTIADQKPPIWYYSVLTGKWRCVPLAETQASSFAGYAFEFPVGYSAGRGWFTDEGATWKWLSASHVITSTSVYNKSNTQYQSYMHVVGSIGYRVGGNANNYLYSKHPLDDISTSTKYLCTAYPALSGLDVTNMASVLMPDGRIIIFPVSGTTVHALILDPVADTVTDTGYTYAGLDGTLTNFELASEWAPELNCALFLSRRCTPSRLIAFRP